jgi:probable phosphoglycerate mutase
VWSHVCPGGEDAAAVTQRCEALIAQLLALEGNIALFAHGHLLRSLAGTWIGQGAVGGKHLALGTGSHSLLGFERENPVILRWNAPCP